MGDSGSLIDKTDVQWCRHFLDSYVNHIKIRTHKISIAQKLNLKAVFYWPIIFVMVRTVWHLPSTFAFGYDLVSIYTVSRNRLK